MVDTMVGTMVGQASAAIATAVPYRRTPLTHFGLGGLLY